MSQLDPKALSHDLTIELYGASRFHAEENVRLTQENTQLKAQLAELTMPTQHEDPNTVNVECSIGRHDLCIGTTADTQGTTIRCECECHAVGDEA